MRFNVAWAETLSQNVTLRGVVLVLSITSLVFAVSTARLALREPLLIERSCFTRTLTPKTIDYTDEEIEVFLKTAIPARFDSNARNYQALLSESEFTAKQNEEAQFSKKQMTQRVLVNSVQKDKSDFIIDADRIIGVEKVRSALPFPLRVELRTVTRSEENPYGLIVARVSQFQGGVSK